MTEWDKLVDRDVLVRPRMSTLSPVERRVTAVSANGGLVRLSERTEVMGPDGLETKWEHKWYTVFEIELVDTRGGDE